MTAIPVNLAVEDELSEAVLRRLLYDANRGYAVGSVYGRQGYGYLRSTIVGWNRAAKGIPFIVLTDLDSAECPASLLKEWLAVPQHPNLVLRVAVGEVEAWLLADRRRLSRFLRVPEQQLPLLPESLTDAKGSLVSLAAKSRSRDIRARIAPKAGSTAKQGPDYNACLTEFVRTDWDLNEAQQSAPSMARTIARLATFNPVWL
jgi:hypothetical protein